MLTAWNQRAGLAVCAAVAAVSPARADDGVPRLLLDDTLRAAPVRLLSVSMRSITYLDARGQEHTERLDRFLAFLPGSGQEVRETPTTTVDLADGQRLAGHPIGRPLDHAVPTPDGSLLWGSPDFGELAIPLDAVRRMTLDWSGAGGEQPVARDQLILANGDVLEGFVESIGDPTVLDRDDGMVEVPMERIAQVRLGGPSVPPSGVFVWLRDGSAVRVSSMSTSGAGFVTIVLAPIDAQAGESDLPSAELTLESLQAAAFDMSRLVPLASIAVERQAVSPDRVFGGELRLGPRAGAVLGAPDIEFPGPMSATWLLPAGLERFGGEAVLPEDCRVWGDCVLVFSVEGAEVYRAGLNSASPAAEFNIELPASDRGLTLRAEVEAGAYGPIQDRVVLRRTVLLMPGSPRR